MTECLYQNVYVAMHTVVCSFSLFEQQICTSEKKIQTKCVATNTKSYITTNKSMEMKGK